MYGRKELTQMHYLEVSQEVSQVPRTWLTLG